MTDQEDKPSEEYKRLSAELHAALRSPEAKRIDVAFAEAEEAIRRQPQESIRLYESGSSELDRHTEVGGQLIYASKLNISFVELRPALEYLRAMAFMSAWYHTQGELKKRDEITNAGVLLVTTALDIDPRESIQLIVNYERFWRAQFDRSGLAKPGCSAVVALGIGAAATWLLL